jgi:hypothetical protein
MIIEFKYRDSKNKQQTIIKNLEPGCLSVERVFIACEKKEYWIERKELHPDEPKIVVWLKK